MLNAHNNTNAYFAGPDSTANLEWLFDSGATNHFTTDKSIFNNNTKYHGGEKLVIGDGQVLRMFNMRSSNFQSMNGKLFLKNILHVPQIK